MKPESRRRFLKKSTTASVALAAWTATPSFGNVLGANSRVNIGVIGVGGMGGSHVNDLVTRSGKDNVQCVAVCDVYQKRLNAAKNVSKGRGTMEYERILEDKTIDAVIIATPDHWHAKMAIDAMEAGKDVYLQKPMTLTIEQALEVRTAAKRLKRKLQVGTQYASEPVAWAARDIIAAGKIGKVVWSQWGYCRNSREGQFNWPIDQGAGPTALGDGFIDWDRWLGHEHGLAPKIPFNADHFFRFRKYWAYNGGVATDLLYHALAPLLISTRGGNGEYPRKVVAGGGLYIEQDGRDIPDSFFLTIDYPTGHTVQLTSVMTNDVGFPRIIRGQYGTIEFTKDGLKVSGQETWKKEFLAKNNDQMEFTLQGENRRDHVGNFLDAIRGQAELTCNEDLGCAIMVAIKMGVEAYRQNKVMVWDPEKMKVTAS